MDLPIDDVTELLQAARDAFGRDVVVGGPDPAGREDVRERSAGFVHVANDRFRNVAHDACFLEPYAELAELLGEELQVRILRFP